LEIKLVKYYQDDLSLLSYSDIQIK